MVDSIYRKIHVIAVLFFMNYIIVYNVFCVYLKRIILIVTVNVYSVYYMDLYNCV